MKDRDKILRQISQRGDRQARQTSQRGLQTRVTLTATDGRQRRLELPNAIQCSERLCDGRKVCFDPWVVTEGRFGAGWRRVRRRRSCWWAGLSPISITPTCS